MVATGDQTSPHTTKKAARADLVMGFDPPPHPPPLPRKVAPTGPLAPLEGQHRSQWRLVGVLVETSP